MKCEGNNVLCALDVIYIYRVNNHLWSTASC